MPNHVKNRLTIIAEQDHVRDILERIQFDEYGPGSLDFEKVIPMPPELKVTKSSRSEKALEFYTLYVKHEHDSDPGAREKLMKEYQADQAFVDFGKQLYENKQNHGAADWFDWSVENWGTKWNGYGYEDAPAHEGGAEIIFKTAWSRPEPVIKGLSWMFPEAQFRHQWADEDMGRNVGEILYHNGEEIEWDIPNAHSKEAYEMAADIWGMPLSEWNLHYDESVGTYAYWEKEDLAIKQITTEELKRTTVGEGLILQGCGGDLADWVHGLNKQLALEGILQNGSKFTEYYAFEHDGLTNILFSMDNVDLHIGRLAAWRLQTHSMFGGYWLSDYLPNKFGVELGALAPEPPPEPETPKAAYTLKAYIEHPDRPDDGGFSMPLPSSREVFEPFLDNLRIKDIHDVKIGEIYSTHDDDNNLSYWLNEALRGMDGPKSLDELNYLAAKISSMDEEQRDMFAANLQMRQHTGSLAEMINLTENPGAYYLQPAFSAESYGEFLIIMQQDDPYGCFERLKSSKNEDDRDFAQYIKRLEDCVDHEAYAKMRAKEEGGLFTDYGYMLPNFDMKEIYRGVQDIPPEHRISKPSLMETLQRNSQKSREQFGDPASSIKIKENEDPSL